MAAADRSANFALNFVRPFAIDLRSLAVFRCALACALLARVLGTMPEAGAFLSDEGVLPRALAVQLASSAQLSLYFANGSPAFASFLLGLEAAAALCLLIGFRARFAAVICWVLHLSLAARNPFIGSGGDLLAPLLLFWAMFLPISERFSVEAALAEGPRKRSEVLNVASVGLLLQVSYVYFFGALMKQSPEWFTNGSAVYAALHNDTIATQLAHHVRPYVFFTQPLTFFVLWLEILTPFLLFLPFWTSAVRMIVLPLLILMHIGFRLFLDIGEFWLVSIASLMAFIPAAFWSAWRERGDVGSSGVAIYYDRDCAFCRKVSLLLRAVFLDSSKPVLPAQDHHDIGPLLEREQSWVVTDASGGRHLKWDALVFVAAQRHPRLAAALRRFGQSGRGVAFYDFIGRHRKVLGQFTRGWSAPSAYGLARPTQLALVAVVVFCFVWNVSSLPGVQRPPVIQRVGDAARTIGLTQTWGMFAPRPHLDYAIPIVEGRLRDGRRVDLYRRRFEPPAEAWPRYPIEVLASSYWTGYFDAVALRLRRNRDGYITAYANYSCRRWNRLHPDVPLQSMKLTFLARRTLSNYESEPILRVTHERTCSGIV